MVRCGMNARCIVTEEIYYFINFYFFGVYFDNTLIISSPRNSVFSPTTRAWRQESYSTNNFN